MYRVKQRATAVGQQLRRHNAQQQPQQQQQTMTMCAPAAPAASASAAAPCALSARRRFHSSAPRRSEEEDMAAKIAAHRERMRLAKLNPKPAEPEPEAAAAEEPAAAEAAAEPAAAAADAGAGAAASKGPKKSFADEEETVRKPGFLSQLRDAFFSEPPGREIMRYRGWAGEKAVIREWWNSKNGIKFGSVPVGLKSPGAEAAAAAAAKVAAGLKDEEPAKEGEAESAEAAQAAKAAAAASAKSATAQRAAVLQKMPQPSLPRPVPHKSVVKPEHWSTDPLDRARREQEASTEADAEAKAKAEEEELLKPIAEEVPYTGPTALMTLESDLTVHQQRLIYMHDTFIGWHMRLFRLFFRPFLRSEKVASAKQDLTEQVEDAREVWETSQDPRLHRVREVGEKVFVDTDVAQAITTIMETDPSFNLSDFLAELEEVMVPEVIGALRCGDQKLLVEATDGDARSAMRGYFQGRDTTKTEPDPRILDIHGIDVVKAEFGDDDVPRISVSFVCQHVAAERSTNKETFGELVEPNKEHEIQNVYYSWVLKRDYTSQLYNWKIIDFKFMVVKALV